VKYVCMMMAKDSSNPRSQMLGCKIFCNLCNNNPDVRKFLAVCLNSYYIQTIQTTQVIPKLIATLKAFPNNAQVIVPCFMAISNLCYHSPLGRSKLLTHKGAEHVLSCVATFKSNPKLVLEGMKVRELFLSLIFPRHFGIYLVLFWGRTRKFCNILS
jgi:hypothetical protein